jgi:hypothetical protein
MQSYIRPPSWSTRLRAMMEFAHRVPIACEAFETTIVHGLNPAAVTAGTGFA